MSTSERKLREALTRVPEVPEDPGFAARVVDRARRRRQRRAAVASGLAVAAVVLVVAWAGVSSRPEAVEPTHPMVTPTGLDVLDCNHTRPSQTTGSPVVPAGAIAARLCGGLIDNGGYDSLWPNDILRGRYVERLIARVNQMRPFVQPPRFCQAVGGPSFDLVLAYPDGSQARLTGSVAGNCARLEAADGSSWRDPEPVLRDALALIEEQRQQDGPSHHPDPASCPERWQDVFITVNADPLAKGAPVAVTACQYRLHLNPRFTDQSANGPLRGEVVATDPASLLAMARAGGRVDPCHGKDYRLDPVQDLLLVRNAWGDVNVVTTDAPCWPNTLTGPRRYPTQALADEVAALFS
jgi:hypothetical protein